MSNIALFKDNNVPAFARTRERSSTALALAGSGGGGGKRISIKGGVFRLISDGKEIAAIDDRHLDVVIVNAAPKIARVFYLKSYDADAVTGPDCWSPDGDKPSPDAASPQSTSCAKCPQNIAGSGQGNSRACRYQQRLAVVLANDIEGDVMQLALPATSIFGKAEGDNRPLQAYAQMLVSNNVDPEMVVTRMRFDTKSESPKLFFKAERWLDDEQYATVTEKAQSEDAIKAITMTVAKIDKAPDAPKLEGKRPSKPAAKPAVEESEEDDVPAKPAAKAKAAPKVEVEEDVEEPVVRAEPAKKPAVGGTKSSLAEMVSDWDDED